MDCKTGVAVILGALERLRTGWPQWFCVHALLTVGEESGQKGAIRAPLPQLIGQRVRHAVVVDRMTRGRAAPVGPGGAALRHLVTEYKGVPLLDRGSGEQLLRCMTLAMRPGVAPAAATMVPGIASPNCADALELRGRWDAEVAAPWLLARGAAGPSGARLASAVKEYQATTAEVSAAMALVPAEERISSMNNPPRITRYRAMRKVYDALQDQPLDPSLWFSCVNLSYDYDEASRSCSLEELDMTTSILLGFVANYFASQ